LILYNGGKPTFRTGEIQKIIKEYGAEDHAMSISFEKVVFHSLYYDKLWTTLRNHSAPSKVLDPLNNDKL